MEAVIQAQEARIQQLEAQNRSIEAQNRSNEAQSRSDANQRERERLKIAGELKSEITVLRSQMRTEPAASASSRPPGLEGNARSNLGLHERWKDWNMKQKAYTMAVDADGSLSPRSGKLNAQLCYP